MAFLLVTIDQNVFDKTKNFGIYRDNGIAVFPGTWMQMEVHVEDCLSAFQRAINDKAGNNKLSFTAEVWTPGRDKTKVGGKVGTQTTDQFPFLDMELSWSVEGTVHLKLNQQLNAGSAHTPGYFKAITTGVCYQLTKLTTINENSADMKHKAQGR